MTARAIGLCGRLLKGAPAANAPPPPPPPPPILQPGSGTAAVRERLGDGGTACGGVATRFSDAGGRVSDGCAPPRDAASAAAAASGWPATPPTSPSPEAAGKLELLATPKAKRPPGGSPPRKLEAAPWSAGCPCGEAPPSACAVPVADIFGEGRASPALGLPGASGGRPPPSPQPLGLLPSGPATAGGDSSATMGSATSGEELSEALSQKRLPTCG